jgi:hypothetical protein
MHKKRSWQTLAACKNISSSICATAQSLRSHCTERLTWRLRKASSTSPGYDIAPSHLPNGASTHGRSQRIARPEGDPKKRVTILEADPASINRSHGANRHVDRIVSRHKYDTVGLGCFSMAKHVRGTLLSFVLASLRSAISSDEAARERTALERNANAPQSCHGCSGGEPNRKAWLEGAAAYAGSRRD